MKHLPTLSYLALFAITFYPVEVDGGVLIDIFKYLIFLITQLPFLIPRQLECDSIKRSVGLRLDIPSTDSCYCNDDAPVTLTCDLLQQNICLSPLETTYCTSSFAINEYITEQRGRRFLTPPTITEEKLQSFFEDTANDFQTSFSFTFVRSGDDDDDDDDSTKKYTSCDIISYSYFGNSGGENITTCNSCDICDSGLDFKYNCANVNGATIVQGQTIPGPIVDSCFPVVDLFRSF